MKFLIAPDSFKGSLTAEEAAESIRDGLKKVYPDAEYVIVPMADGGEGTVESLVAATNGQLVSATVHDPLGKITSASYGLLGDSNTAVIEMVAASGLQYVSEQNMNPLVTTTYGTGELIRAALNRDVDQIIIGLGGSATVDGGAGMLQALGGRLIDCNGKEIAVGGGNLDKITQIGISNLDPRLTKVKIIIASDVTNPLTGKNGAAKVFGPQKGATAEMVKVLDNNLHHFATLVKRDLGKDLEFQPGTGAAGGLGFGLLAFTNSTMEKGIEIVTRYSHLAHKAIGADYVFTGEGKIDFQTKFGKTPYGVAKTTKRVSPMAPVIVLTGKIGQGTESLYQEKIIDAIFTTPNGAKSLSQAIADAKDDVKITAENIARLIKKD